MNIIERRVKHGFLLSIGTGLAINAILDPIEEVYEGAEVPKYTGKVETLCVNVRTLTRNLMASLSRDDKRLLTKMDMSKQIKEGVYGEIDYLFNLMRNNNIACVFYIGNEESVKYYPKQVIKNPQSIASTFRVIEDKVVKMLIKHDGIKRGPPKPTSNTLYLTHYPIDMLLDNIKVLESQTGLVLTKPDLGKKLKKVGTRDMTFLPFIKETLYLFGDSNHYIGGVDTKTKVRAYELFKEKGVTPIDKGITIRDIMFKDKEVLRTHLDNIYKIK